MNYYSIIIPALNESLSIEQTLQALKPLIDHGHELIIVDGGSVDDTLSKCKHYTPTILESKKGRAQQMNVGASKAKNDVLIFLHADTIIPDCFISSITDALSTKHQWGFFKVKLSGNNFRLKIVALLMNTRSCLTSIATGDQTIFVTKDIFNKVNGYMNIPLMEDIELSKQLKKISKPCCVNEYVVTASRKWQQEGIVRTILLMWKIRLLYFFGISAEKLVKVYYK